MTKPVAGVNCLRMREFADALGVSLNTVYRRAKDDPDFPPLIRLSARCTVVRQEDVARYLERKAAK